MSLLREAFGGRLTDRPNEPLIGRYTLDDGGAFVFDRSTTKPMMKFSDDIEIWALQPAPGPRGDTIYRNDLGEVMLRSTRIGGMTVFTDKRPDGSAAAFDGAAPPLRVAPVSPTQLWNRFYQDSIRASRVALHQIGFETGQDADLASSAAVADAASVASEALVDIAGKADGRRLLARISDVVIAQGPRPGASLQKGVLTITIVPSQGVFGRPSSRRIERAAGEK
ncbi:MAG TPA: DUF4908 domain-containing protein [Caulobacteraceae bacterium]|nr:DUF4908 domain-containing protein [Caulobacteraceae bacterium]